MFGIESPAFESRGEECRAERASPLLGAQGLGLVGGSNSNLKCVLDLDPWFEYRYYMPTSTYSESVRDRGSYMAG